MSASANSAALPAGAYSIVYSDFAKGPYQMRSHNVISGLLIVNANNGVYDISGTFTASGDPTDITIDYTGTVGESPVWRPDQPHLPL